MVDRSSDGNSYAPHAVGGAKSRRRQVPVTVEEAQDILPGVEGILDQLATIKEALVMELTRRALHSQGRPGGARC